MNTMNSAVLYTAKVHTTGGRDGGTSRSSDGNLDVRHSLPGSTGSSTNPEQLFAAGWSACFGGTMALLARKVNISLPPETAIDAEVDLNSGDDGLFLSARLYVTVPGMDHDVVQALVDAAHKSCPYSKAMRGNVPVTITVL
jgi:Ohr subfamily peroxiredoxin